MTDGGAGAGGRRLAAAPLLPLASGLLLAAAAPPMAAPVFPFVALVPLAVWTAGLPAGPRGALAAAGGGLLAGALQHAWGLRWLPGTLGAVAGGPVGWAAFVAVIAVLGAATGACVCALHALVTRARPVPIAAAFPLVWTGLEWALAHLPFGWAFPWAPLGLGLARWPRALGLAELVGVGGVTAWLAAVNGLAAEAVLAARAPTGAGRARTVALAAVAVALVPVAGGVARAGSLDAPTTGRAAAVALRVPPTASAEVRAELGTAAVERALAAASDLAADLVVLPEMVLPLDPASAGGAPFAARLARGARDAGAPLLVGTLGVDAEGEHNSALLVTGPDAPAAAAFRADKRRLVPGVERARSVRASWLAPRAVGYAPGRGWPVARVGPLSVGALVCFEVAFAQDARRLVRGGARALAALTSDAWFGEGGAGAAGVAQQTAHLTLRVVETRTGAVRASNGGPALILAPTGDVAMAADSGVVAGPLASAAPTVFVRTGDLVGPAAALAVLLLLLIA